MILSYVRSGERNFHQRKVPLNNRAVYEFFLIRKGEAYRTTEESRDCFTPGELIISSPASNHGWDGDPEVVCVYEVFHFSRVPEVLRQILDKQEFISVKLNENEIEEFRNGTNTLKDRYASQDTKDFFNAEMAVLRYSLFALEHYKHDHPDKLGLSKIMYHNQMIINNALTYYQENLGATLQEVADSLGYSVSQLRRIFTKKYKKSPQVVFTEARMQFALGLVVGTDLDFTSISIKMGYKDLSLFSRAFKSHFGISPKQYRDRPPKLSQ